MTLIESFDRSPLQNIAECLAIHPDRLILVGNDAGVEAGAERYRELLQKRNITIPVIPKRIRCAPFDKTMAIFEELIRQNSPCVIDLFGGDEIHLVAAGAAFRRLRDSYDVSLQRMDMEKGAVVRVDGERPAVVGKQPQLSVRESVEIYGGRVFSEETQKVAPYTAADLEPLWEIAKKDPNGWNKKLKALNFFERRNSGPEESLEADVTLDGEWGSNGGVEENRRRFRSLINELEQAGVITVLQKDKNRCRYRYRNAMVRSCLDKEGNVLEYKTYFSVRNCERDGKRLFHDCAVGVTLDWDGVWNDPTRPTAQDTRNEIDIIAMHGPVPVFISCKNGNIDDEELYKLNTVALQLGGEFSKKVLIATDYEPPNVNTKKSLLQRAKDMKIVFVTDAANFSEKDWSRFLEKLTR